MSEESDLDEVGGENRRAAPRLATRVRVRFRSLEDLLTTYTSDMSRGGIYVTAARQLPVDTRIELTLEIPDGLPPAIIPARVAYVVDESVARAHEKRPGMGVQFVDVDTSAIASRIAEYLAAALTADATTEDKTPLRVLVVEDSATYREEIVAALREAGHRVSTAENGLTGLGKAVKELPDIVLSDVNMPAMDGWQMLRLLRARDATRRIPVMFLTTLGSDGDRLRGYELGVDDYVAKPFVREELLSRISATVARTAARAEPPKEAGPTATAMTGDLRLVSLASVLAFAEAERRTGSLVVRSARGETRIALVQGEIARVDLVGDAPAALFERAIRALDTIDGRFELSAVPLPDSGDRVRVQQVLLEHARRADENG